MIDPEQLYIAGKLWGAKDHKFWCLLSSLLIACKPKSILELGAGRSTTFFADYADAENIEFTSIEESPHWYAEIHRDLRFMFLSGKYIKHVPIDHATRWYDMEWFENAVGFNRYDLVMIDGPSGGGTRNFLTNLDKTISNARMVIVDDTQRTDCRELSEHISKKLGFTYSVSLPYKQRRRGPTTGSVTYDENTVTISTSEWSEVVLSQIRNIYGL
jgi:hypothetical protein